MPTDIPYTDETWNPWQGCHKVSPGCDNCYMHRDKKRFGQDPTKVIRSADRTFYAPMKWADGKFIMVPSWSDFFIEEADPWHIDAMEIMAECPQHTFLVFTKRPERAIECIYGKTGGWYLGGGDYLPNVWWIVTCENQEMADKRIPELFKLREKSSGWPVLGVSYEPALGPVDFAYVSATEMMLKGIQEPRGIDWLIMGGESGPNARPMNPNWARAVRDQCIAAGVPYWFKQWGEWAPIHEMRANEPGIKGKLWHNFDPDTTVCRIGKKAAGNLLDGQRWEQRPEVTDAE